MNFIVPETYNTSSSKDIINDHNNHKRCSSQANKRSTKNRKRRKPFGFKNTTANIYVNENSEIVKSSQHWKYNDPYIKVGCDFFGYKGWGSKEYRVSPLGRTSSAWKLSEKQNENLLQHQIHIYKNKKNPNKNNYFEYESQRNQMKKRQIYNKGVRATGRRFPNGRTKRKIIPENSSYELKEMYKANGWNGQHFSKFIENKAPGFVARTPQKNSATGFSSKI